MTLRKLILVFTTSSRHCVSLLSDHCESGSPYCYAKRQGLTTKAPGTGGLGGTKQKDDRAERKKRRQTPKYKRNTTLRKNEDVNSHQHRLELTHPATRPNTTLLDTLHALLRQHDQTRRHTKQDQAGAQQTNSRMMNE